MAGEADSVLGLFRRTFSGSIAPVPHKPQVADQRVVGTCDASGFNWQRQSAVLDSGVIWQGRLAAFNTGIAGTYGTDAHDYGARLKALETAVQQLALAVELSSLDQADDHDEKQYAKPDEPDRPVDITYLPA